MDDFTFDGKELCTEEQWTEFFQHACWKEFLDTIKIRLSMTRTELETCSREEFERFQGEATTLRFCLAFPDNLLEEFKQNRKDQEDERTESDD